MKQSIFTEQDQNNLLIYRALNRLSQNELATQIGLSRPTVQSLLNDDAPIVISPKTYNAVHTVLSNK